MIVKKGAPIEAINEAYKEIRNRGFKKGHGGSGTMPCPHCKTGTLHFRVASINGHVHGQCETEGCLRWME